VPENLIITVINSTFISRYVDDFVNNTQTFQMNDARQLPIIIPSAESKEYARALVERAIDLKIDGNEKALRLLQKEADEFVAKLYKL